MLLLICAATGTEARACRAALQAPWLSEAGARAEVLLTGVGPRRAEAALTRRLALPDRPALVISSGFAGGLSPALETGNWVLAETFYSETVQQPLLTQPKPSVLLEAFLRRFEGARRVRMLSVSRIDPRAQAQLAENTSADDLPLSVDMESAAIAQQCLRHGVSMLALRFLTDTPAAPLPGFVGEFTEAFCADSTGARVQAALAGLKHVLRNPAAPAHLIRQGIGWNQSLAAGWRNGLQKK